MAVAAADGPVIGGARLRFHRAGAGHVGHEAVPQLELAEFPGRTGQAANARAHLARLRVAARAAAVAARAAAAGAAGAVVPPRTAGRSARPAVDRADGQAFVSGTA